MSKGCRGSAGIHAPRSSGAYNGSEYVKSPCVTVLEDCCQFKLDTIDRAIDNACLSLTA